MKKANELNVRGTAVRVAKIGDEDFVSLTDVAATRNPNDPRFVVQSWMRNRMTVLFLELWEELNNPDFNRVGFEAVKEHAGENAFSLSPAQWIAQTKAMGMVSKAGRYGGGTYDRKNLNAVMIEDGIPQPQRLKRLNEIAIHQMKVLSTGPDNRNLLK